MTMLYQKLCYNKVWYKGIALYFFLKCVLIFGRFYLFLQNIHPTIQKTHIERRQQKMLEGTGLDWATGEALAIGSLLSQGMVNVLKFRPLFSFCPQI